MKLKQIAYALSYGKSRKQLVRSEGARRVKQAEWYAQVEYWKILKERQVTEEDRTLFKYVERSF